MNVKPDGSVTFSRLVQLVNQASERQTSLVIPYIAFVTIVIVSSDCLTLSGMVISFRFVQRENAE